MIAWLLTHSLWAQRENVKTGFESIGNSEVIDTTDGVLPVDTPVAMSYVLLDNPGKVYTVSDTFLWQDNQHHPLSFYQAHLGNYGSPTRFLIPQMHTAPGFDLGWHQFDPYFLHQDSFPYFNQSTPAVKARYSFTNIDNSYFDLVFGRSFANGFSMSLLYSRINQIGIYANQHQTNTAFGIGIHYSNPSGRYESFYNFISNTADQEENGGIANPELIFSDNLASLSIPVFIQGHTRFRTRSFVTRQIIRTVKREDLGLDLWVNAAYDSKQYSFTDPANNNDIAYYGPLYLNDERGIRQSTYLEKVSIEPGISFPWQSASSQVHSSIEFSRILYDQGALKNNFTEVYWKSGATFNWLKALVIKGNFDLGLGGAKGTFLFQAEGELDTDIAGKIRGYYKIHKQKPYAVHSSLFVNQQPVYSNDFAYPVTNEIGAVWNWQKQDLQVGVKWFVFDRFIYFDSVPVPVQLDESFSVRQVFGSKGFDFKWIGTRAEIYWQPESKAELAIPDLVMKGSLYGRFRLFDRKATVMPGIDVVYHSGYNGVGYFPATGQYHLTYDQPIPEYTRVDAALGVHINFLKLFVRMEDVEGLLKKRALYQADYYPHYTGYLRLGISAGFFN